jgi:hypothetical protein
MKHGSLGVLAVWIASGSFAAVAHGQEPLVAAPARQFSREASEPILPPLIPWDGKSRALVVPKNDPWITPGGEERSPHDAELRRDGRVVAQAGRGRAAAVEDDLASGSRPMGAISGW